MTRILPLLPLMLWLVWSDQGGDASLRLPPDWSAVLPMLLGVLLIVAVMAGWARMLLRAHRHSSLPVPTRGFYHGMLVGRVALVAWYGVALYQFGYGTLVDTLLRPLHPYQLHLPGLIAGIWPVVVGWIGLWWAAYPVERATREQNLLAEIDAGLTPRAPPTLGQTIASNLRMQVLFVLAPILAVFTIRDATLLLFDLLDITMSDRLESILFVSSSLFVFIASPELLVAVLRARPLADSPLRQRLELMAQQLDLRYRDILVWHTSYGIGNAMVMGLVPRFRYVLLTDLLIETLDDRQIEAVFAHEAGHVKHRHLLWYGVFWIIYLLSIAGPGDAMLRLLHVTEQTGTVIQVGIWLGTFAVYLMLFGMLSRLFEKQADVFAARSIQSIERAARSPSTQVAAPMATPVGSLGAESFVSALCRVAEINHRPIVRPMRRRTGLAATAEHAVDAVLNFTHPSFSERIDHLRTLALQATSTTRFDKKVITVMLGMLFVLVTLSTWAIVEQVR